MSLSRGILSLPNDEQERAIRTLARKTARVAIEKHLDHRGKKRFDTVIRPLTHAMHAAGANYDMLRATRKLWRKWFGEERDAVYADAAKTGLINS